MSTAKQDLDRQQHALGEVGIPAERTFVDKKSDLTTDRPGLRALLGYARAGDVIVVYTLDRLGRTVRDTLNLIHDLSTRGVGVRNLADPIRIDSSNPDDPMAQLAVVLLALFGQMERTYTRAALPRPRAICPELAGITISLRKIVAARRRHRRDLAATLAARRATVEELMTLRAGPAPIPTNPEGPTPPGPDQSRDAHRLKLYAEE